MTNAKRQQRRRHSEYLTGQKLVMVVPIERDVVNGVMWHGNACAGRQVQVRVTIRAQGPRVPIDQYKRTAEEKAE